MTSTQFFALTSDVSSTLGDTYTALGCGLQWSNYQLPVPAIGGGLVSTCSWQDPILSSYIKLAIASIVMLAALFLHKTINLIWRFFSPQGKLTLPPLLAFPRLEIAIASTTIICYSQSVAVLLASTGTIPRVIGSIAGAYFLVLVSIFGFFCYIIIKYRSLIDNEEETKVSRFTS